MFIYAVNKYREGYINTCLCYFLWRVSCVDLCGLSNYPSSCWFEIETEKLSMNWWNRGIRGKACGNEQKRSYNLYTLIAVGFRAKTALREKKT